MVLKTKRRAGLGVGDLRGWWTPDFESPESTAAAVAATACSAAVLTAIGRALNGRGSIDLEEVEQMIGGDVGQAAGEQHREDAVFANGFVERGDQVLLGNGALGEVLFHELVFAFGDQFHQGFVGGLGAVQRRLAGISP